MTRSVPEAPEGAADRQHRRSGRRLVWAAATGALAICGTGLLYAGFDADRPPPRPPAAAAVPIPRADPGPGPVGATAGPAGAAEAPAPAPEATPMRASFPTRIRIPTLDISAPLARVGLDKDGGIDVPAQAERNLAGWYQGGVTPGQKGTASIAGHVDTAAGPAVFYPLGALPRGSRIEIDREDGSVAAFEVDGVEAFAKDTFPTARVFGDAARPELRLITCGGAYSKKNHYSGNVVVFAHLVP
ncbi:class F sortase [Embleya hyalina]|uniref:Class F sortase n=1 Tax=Embleya hyalina TaxID=516124 RepID=A0A401YJL5_9ACTN|nr:class F sortase [Embleya hyalina]GCD94758.1 class F sortase [Embleya hyalina]